jgi:hypothetical protein
MNEKMWAFSILSNFDGPLSEEVISDYLQQMEA